ncbi:MAG TPA: DUF3515 domain-containing protein [Frankiaceae bacterium]|nr:DUF3515 domain-containing protein [Frankiaceae bacterium]
MRTAAVAALAVVAAGCTGNDLPTVPVTAVPTAASAACERFARALPDHLGEDLPRRETEPADPHVAAYGEPPVVIRCGAPTTRDYEQGDPLYDVNGVDWFPEERGDVVVWSLPRAFVNVEVTIPRRWSGDRLARLADAVRATR